MILGIVTFTKLAQFINAFVTIVFTVYVSADMPDGIVMVLFMIGFQFDGGLLTA
jgi:hypothetical protein